ncbi:lysostaphin resistance A-like protein [Lacticaseibacillus sp. GG6-2]
MHKLNWGIRLVILLGLMILVGEYVIGYGTRLLQLAYAPHLLIYKGLELLLILGVNRWLVHQKLHVTPLKWVTSILLLLFWLVIAVVTWKVAGGMRVVNGIVVGIVAAATEEVMFRGIVFAQLRKHWGMWPAIIVSGLLFGGLHLINLTHQGAFMTLMQNLQAAAMGMMLAALYLRSGSLLAPMSFHFSLDFIAVAIHGTSGTPVATQSMLLAGSLFWVMIYLAATVVILYGSRKPLRLLAKA